MDYEYFFFKRDGFKNLEGTFSAPNMQWKNIPFFSGEGGFPADWSKLQPPYFLPSGSVNIIHTQNTLHDKKTIQEIDDTPSTQYKVDPLFTIEVYGLLANTITGYLQYGAPN